MPSRPLEAAIHDLVAGLAADLVPLVRQAAVEAVNEALARQGFPSLEATRVVELRPAAPPERADPAEAAPRARRASSRSVPPSMPKGLPTAAASLDEPILALLAKRPGLRAEEITKALVADPSEVKRTLAALRADRQVQTTGQKRGMRYTVAVDDGPGAKPSRHTDAVQDEQAEAEPPAPVARR